MPLLSQTLIQDRYTLQNRLSSNGPRQTWQAFDQTSEQVVTLKALFFGEGMAWQDLKLAERAAQTLTTLQHPQIPKFIEAFWLSQPEGNYYCLVQLFIPGISLAERIEQGQRFSEAEVRAIAQSVLEILIYLHDQAPQVIHRDIKPSNLIMDEQGNIYLIDFGAVQAELTVGATITIVGTYGYMPPEQFSGQTLPASDLYALGATLLFLLTGINPINLPKKNLRLQLPDEFQTSVVLRFWLGYLLEPDSEKRFSSARVALQALCTNILPDTETNIFPAMAAAKPERTAIKIEKSKEQLTILISDKGMTMRDFLRMISAIPTVGGAFISFGILIFSSVWMTPSLVFWGTYFFVSIGVWISSGMASFLLFQRTAKLISALFDEVSTVILDLNKEQAKIAWTSTGLRYMRSKEFPTSDINGIEFTNTQNNFKNTGDICFLVAGKNGCQEIKLRSNLTSQERAWVVYELRLWLSSHAQEGPSATGRTIGER